MSAACARNAGRRFKRNDEAAMGRFLRWTLEGLAVISLAIALLAAAAYVWSIHHPYVWSDARRAVDSGSNPADGVSIHTTTRTQRGEILYEWNYSSSLWNLNILHGPPVDWLAFQRSVAGNEFAPISGRPGLLQKLGFDHWYRKSEDGVDLAAGPYPIGPLLPLDCCFHWRVVGVGLNSLRGGGRRGPGRARSVVTTCALRRIGAPSVGLRSLR